MHRFFVAPELLPSKIETIILPKKLAHQVRDVLHLAVGEQLVLLDNSGDEFLCAVTKTDRTDVTVRVLDHRAGSSESPVRIILCQGLLKSAARFEWMLEKGTELGVAVFAPTLCHRCIAGLEDAGPSKLQRWQRIIQEAAEQCGRSCIPDLLPIRPLAHALNALSPNVLPLMPWEEEQELSLRDALQRNLGAPSIPLTVVLFIGPEGGLTVEEVVLAQQHEVQIVTLGSRILRAETAALATVTSVMYELDHETKSSS